MAAYDETTAFLQSQATRAIQFAENTTRTITDGRAPNLADPRVRTSLEKPNLGPPPNFGDLFQGGDNTGPEIDQLNAEVTAWMERYFPAINDCLKEIPEDWLCDVISGVRPFGLSQTYFELVWHQARDRAARTRRSEVMGIEEDFSRRGFSIPPGAMVAAMSEARQRESDTVLEVNRDQAIKDAEIKLDLLKFAEEQALGYKIAVMNALAGFYREWFRAPDRDVERARVRAQAYSSLYSALSTYYNVEIAFEQLKLRKDEADGNLQLGTDRNKIAVYTGTNVPNALANAVRAFGDVAASSANAASTLVANITTGDGT